MFFTSQIGLIFGFVSLFMNDMLLTSWLFSSILAFNLFLVIPTRISAPFSNRLSYFLLRAPIAFLGYILTTAILKVVWSRLLSVQDDVRTPFKFIHDFSLINMTYLHIYLYIIKKSCMSVFWSAICRN